MRCCASPITCTADSRAAAQPAIVAQPEREAFATLLLGIALRPLAKPLGFFGDVAVEACARAVAHSGAFDRALPSAVGEAAA